MSTARPPAPQPVPISLEPTEGWHCSHFYYRFDRGVLAQLGAEAVRASRDELIAILDPAGDGAPQRLQTSVVSGHKADFGLMVMDPNPLKIEAVHQRLLASKLGPALVPTYSFVSITEISEYVPTVEQYGKKLVDEGDAEGSPAYAAKLKAYGDRLPMMNRQRLTPEFPPWPATLEERSRMMSEHAKSGMTFAGKVQQLITVSLGLDDWEWGVTLWAKNPQYLTHIVYRMRFDEASARYAEFGPFYTSYIVSPAEMLERCRVGI
jgi:peroxiredoxin